MIGQPKTDNRDPLDSHRRFVAGITTKSRLELDFFNLYGWLLQHIEGKKVLDAACGSGLGSFILAHKAQEVMGIDFSTETIAYAKEKYILPNLRFIQGDILRTDLPAKYFDTVISAMTIEQIESHNQAAFLERLAASIKSEGYLFLITPNKQVTSPNIPVPLLHWNKKELYRHEIEDLLKKNGFTVLRWFGRRRVPFFMANRFTKRVLNAIQKITGKSHGFYGQRESPEVKPINFFWQPKDFVVMARARKSYI